MNSLTVLQTVRPWIQAGFNGLLLVNKRKTKASVSGNCKDLLTKGTADFCLLPLSGHLLQENQLHVTLKRPMMRKCGLLQTNKKELRLQVNMKELEFLVNNHQGHLVLMAN